MSQFDIKIITKEKVERSVMESIITAALKEKGFLGEVRVHQETLSCEGGKRAEVGDVVRVIGKPERFFCDVKEDMDITGEITEIAWYGDDFGFVVNGEKFLLYNVSRRILIE